jgi:hypothetical protein
MVSDFVHGPDSKELEDKNTTSSGTQQSRCLPSPEDGNRSSLQNVFLSSNSLDSARWRKSENPLILMISMFLLNAPGVYRAFCIHKAISGFRFQALVLAISFESFLIVVLIYEYIMSNIFGKYQFMIRHSVS